MADIDFLRDQLENGDEAAQFDALTDIGKTRQYALANAALPFLRHASGELRAAAARTLGFHLRVAACRDTLAEFARSDPDTEVRGASILGWSTLLAGTRDVEALRILNRYLRDPTAPYLVRANAFWGLLDIGALPRSRWPAPQGFGNIDADVPWSLVDEVMDNANPIRARVRRQLRDGTVWQDRDCIHPHDGLQRMLCDAGNEQRQYAEAILECLSDPDLRLRTGATATLSDVVSVLGAERVAVVLEPGNPLLHAVLPAWPIGAGDLEHGVAQALSRRATPSDKAAIHWLRDVARNREWSTYVLAGLARIDGDWLIANARALVPHSHLGVLAALPEALRLTFVDALAPWPAEHPDFFTRAFWNRFSADERSRLRARMWPQDHGY